MSASLVLIDAMNIIRRVFEANPATDIQQKVDDALLSSLRSFRRALKTHPADYGLAVFDPPGSTWRHRIYPLYKAGRSPMPNELRAALPDFMLSLKNELGLKSVMVDDVEADDVIASLTRRWESGGFGGVVIVSCDKDVAQLMSDRVQIYDHFKKEFRDRQWSLDKFGVAPELIGDLLSLAGDSSDGIPGVPSVGVKTAAKWLNAYGSLDAVIESADEIKGKVGEALAQHIPAAYLSRMLVAMRSDVRTGVAPEDARLSGLFNS